MTLIEKSPKHIVMWEEWLPWENTLLYCPLEDDYEDHSWKKISITTQWTTPLKDSSWYYLFGSWIFVTSNISSPTYCTLSVWWKSNINPDSTYRCLINHYYSPSSPYSISELFFTSGNYILMWWSNVVMTWIPASNYNTKNRNHYLWTFDWTAMKFYMNWVLVSSASASSLTSWDKPFHIWWFQYNNGTNTQYWSWYLSEVIYENKAWTADEITKYYNLTKANYGL